MNRIVRYGSALIGLFLVVLVGSGGTGYLDALSDAQELKARADGLIAAGRGGDSLGAEHLDVLLQVEDPGFFVHSGVDFSTPGAGMTTISQSLSKRLAFASFQPGYSKIRQTGYALGLERRLSKQHILALWLDTLEIGRGPNGWMIGLHAASSAVYGRRPSDLNRAEFIRLVAVVIAPGKYDLTHTDAELSERSSRIEKLITGACVPRGWMDVWLQGCSFKHPAS
ncbi:MAG: transglycosylase domain-containing protein [Ottowia sp.]|uniref:transglycosylase domain-containing protein n=1 Tax=Ottowia sp. TaxID=1898956 RepID=UPI003C70FAFF